MTNKEYNSLVSYRTALLAKDKGFDIKCRDFFVSGNPKSFDDIIFRQYDCIEQPELIVLQQWLMEKREIIVIPEIDMTSYPKFCFKIYKYSYFGNYLEIKPDEWFLYTSYAEALEEGLYQALKNI